MRLPRRRRRRPDVEPRAVTTTYYAVHVDEGDPLDAPVGLYRRDLDVQVREVLAEAFHPRTGWTPTDYWRALRWDGTERHLVEVDVDRAAVVRDLFAVRHAGPDDPQA